MSSELPEASRSGACITDFSFDCWSAHELPKSEEEELVAHLAGCVRCQQRRAELDSARAAFLVQFPYRAPSVARGGSRRARSWMTGAALALAAVVLLIARSSEHGSQATRFKGAERIGFYVKHGASVQRGVPGQQVRAGDQLRFVYTAREPSYLALLSYDGEGQVNVYYPAGPRAVLVGAGNEVALPSSVILDGALGREAITSLFCDHAIELAPLAERLRVSNGALPTPVGCRALQLVLYKEPP